ncbi:hypothetical protein [Thioalkalivibrio sp. ALMg13-2]|uniref:hypothetical protein n=1 Tax=Thioalkalivibrio sp. ALMg13-2 TaxID=1158167 RepID=UPI0003A26DFD|nr:hypothetical protein [Thioalkalivibrio sp. ALMg13-2]
MALTQQALAEAYPETADELWERMPSQTHDLRPGDRITDYRTPFCEQLRADFQERPEKFERIRPDVETDDFDDPALRAMLPGCSRKELTFVQEKTPGMADTGYARSAYYADEGFALWSLQSIDPDYPEDVVLVWQGPRYVLTDDPLNPYRTPEERRGYERRDADFGRIAGVNPETCEFVPRYSASTRGRSKDLADPPTRDLFIVRYEGELFYFNGAVRYPKDQFLIVRLIYPGTEKYCSYFYYDSE